MKIKKKRTLKLFGIIDVVAIEEYLETMAAKGWIFNGCSGIFYTFIKGEPSISSIMYLCSTMDLHLVQMGIT